MASTTVNFTGRARPRLAEASQNHRGQERDFGECAVECATALFGGDLRGGSELAHNENYATLLAFSLGRLDDLIVMMRKLGIDSEEDLFLLMAQAHLPMPRLPEAKPARWWRPCGTWQSKHRADSGA